MTREALERLAHVLEFKSQSSTLGQVLLDPTRQGCARAHDVLPGQGSATSANAPWLSLA